MCVYFRCLAFNTMFGPNSYLLLHSTPLKRLKYPFSGDTYRRMREIVDGLENTTTPTGRYDQTSLASRHITQKGGVPVSIKNDVLYL